MDIHVVIISWLGLNVYLPVLLHYPTPPPLFWLMSIHIYQLYLSSSATNPAPRVVKQAVPDSSHKVSLIAAIVVHGSVMWSYVLSSLARLPINATICTHLRIIETHTNSSKKRLCLVVYSTPSM